MIKTWNYDVLYYNSMLKIMVDKSNQLRSQTFSELCQTYKLEFF